VEGMPLTYNPYSGLKGSFGKTYENIAKAEHEACKSYLLEEGE